MKSCKHAITIFSCFISIFSCQKKFEDPSGITGNATDTFKVVVNGISFPASKVSVTNISNNINLVASDALGLRKVSLSLPSAIDTGTYPLDFSNNTYFGMYNPDTSTDLVSDNGTLVIIENDVISKRMRAIFDFNARYVNGSTTFAQLTDGYFSIRYP